MVGQTRRVLRCLRIERPESYAVRAQTVIAGDAGNNKWRIRYELERERKRRLRQ